MANPNGREILTVANFKGINHLQLEVSPFTALIGPQSVGKSVAAKLLYFFKRIKSEVFAVALTEGPSDAALIDRLRERFCRLLPSPTHSSGTAEIKYQVGEDAFTLSGKAEAKWEIEIPDFLRQEFDRLGRLFRSSRPTPDDEAALDSLSLVRATENHRFQQLIAVRLGESAAMLPRFIPSGRSFYAQVERNFVAFFESADLDPFVADFAKFLTHVKSERLYRGGKEPPSGQRARELVEQLLSGRYVRESQKDFLLVEDGRKLPSALWSSGQQEALPLALVLQRYSEGFFRSPSGMALFVEEPEAHLFPSSQRTMVELIALAFNGRPKRLNVFLTTHSPYVLTTLNNLIKAGQLYSEDLPSDNKLSIQEIVPKDIALSPSSVAAFYMDRQDCRSIVDPETRLISADAIDEVSRDIAEQFELLLDAENK